MHGTGVRERKSSIVKYGKMSYRSRLVKILCDPPCMDHMETVEYTWVKIWCMIDQILSQNCRNVPS